jgi:hypothetical protein
MYEYKHAFGALGTNGKTSGSTPSTMPNIPTDRPLRPGEMDEIMNQIVWDASGRGVPRAELEQRAAREATRQAERVAAVAERASYFEQNPGALAAAQFGGCLFGSLIWGAVIGAIASPKGERGGGAKWGILASMATCPMVPLWARIGYIGTVMNVILAVGAPIAAARYRLKHKRERAALPARAPA